MKTTKNVAATAALAGLLSVVAFAPVLANDAPSQLETIKPVSGAGAAPNQRYLHSQTIGAKQAVSYFLNDNGRCKLTLMVGDAFNGEDVPQMNTVRFETVVTPENGARLDTAHGKTLEYSCEEGASSMSIRMVDHIASYTSGM